MTPATNPASVVKLKNNTVYVGPDGTVVLKGTGDAMGAAFVCVLPTGPYRVLVDSVQKQALGFAYENVDLGVKNDQDRKQRLDKVYELSERALIRQQILGNACVLLGNGVFGPLCDQTQAGACKSGMPASTLAAYNAFVEQQMQFMVGADAPAETPP